MTYYPEVHVVHEEETFHSFLGRFFPGKEVYQDSRTLYLEGGRVLFFHKIIMVRKVHTLVFANFKPSPKEIEAFLASCQPITVYTLRCREEAMSQEVQSVHHRTQGMREVHKQSIPVTKLGKYFPGKRNALLSAEVQHQGKKVLVLQEHFERRVDTTVYASRAMAVAEIQACLMLAVLQWG